MGAAAAAAILLTGLLLALDALLPPDLSRFEDRGTLVVDRQDRILRAFLSADDKWRLAVEPEDVDSRFLSLLKIYEDRRFDTHPGVDVLAVLRAAGQLVRHGEVVSGASTLTMQAARLLEPGPRGFSAKIRQALRALQLEWRFSKREILRIYLTLAPYGGNLEGVRAASLAWFGKEPVALTLGEAALLVALPQSPERQRPDRFLDAARTGRDKVLARLRAAGAIDEQAFAEARAEAVPNARRPFPFHAPRLARDLARRAPGAPLVRTGIDLSLQTAVEEMALRHARSFDDGASLAVMVANNDTLEVRAYLGGHDFGGPAGQVDLAAAVRSPGSALKPFIYAFAFDDLLVHPETLIEDRRMAFGAYAPRNFDRSFQGTVTVRTALQQSLNVPAVALLDHVGPNRLYAGLRQSGARLALPPGSVEASLPLALGGVGVTLRDLTMLYAGLAKGGRFTALRYDREAPPAPPRRLFGEEAAWYVTDILRGVPLPDGWGQARNIVRERRVAFKTGTSAAFQDAWAIGYSRAYTVGVWTGRADASARPGRIGRNAAAPVMLQIFTLLPAESADIAPQPENILTVRSAEELPIALRHFDVRDGIDGFGEPDRLRLVYPPDGSSVLYPHADRTLTLTAEGGRGPLRFIVNGRVLPPEADNARVATWTVDGAGFVKVSVVDAEGRSDQATFRIVR